MQTFVSNGVALAYLDLDPEGVDLGEPILLIHGFASTHRINWAQPSWTSTLTKAGRRTILLDNRGHGESEKLYDPQAYETPRMAEDAANLLAQLVAQGHDVTMISQYRGDAIGTAIYVLYGARHSKARSD